MLYVENIFGKYKKTSARCFLYHIGKMAWSGYQIGGTFAIFIGIILLIAGIVVLAIDQNNQKTSEWWVWALIVIGVIALLVGIGLFFIPPAQTDLEKSLKMQSDCLEPGKSMHMVDLSPVKQPSDPCDPSLPVVDVQRVMPCPEGEGMPVAEPMPGGRPYVAERSIPVQRISNSALC